MMHTMTGAPRGRPYLGDRAVVTATLPVTVRAFAERLADEHGLDLSPYLADVICHHYDRPDLMRNLRQFNMFDADGQVSELTGDQLGRHLTIRLPVPVARDVESEAVLRHVKRSTLLADIVCLRLGFPGLVRALDKEVLPLAI